jgi:aspartate/methionine/tyrosine aminotransferase
MRLAGHYERLGTERAFEVLAQARALEAQGRNVIHLEIGEPDFATPPHVVEAGVRALREGHTHYCPAPGLPELREAAAEHLSKTRGVEVEPSRVLVAPGAKWFLFFGVLAVAGEGDEVIYPNPGYPIYESAINWSGATAVPLPITEETGFAFTASDLADRLTPRTRMVILNSPANPTGGAIDREQNSEIAEILAGHDCWILGDEIYSELLYEGAHDSITSHGLLDRTILLDGFSKTYAMTGWRLGYAAVPPALIEPLSRFLINSVACTAPAVQLAGVAALTGPHDAIDAMVAEFMRRRRVLVDGLNRLPGVSCIMPRGAFYAFPNVTATGIDERTLATRLLEEAGVAVLAGTDFGEHGAGHIRLSYANSIEHLQEALEQMSGLLEAVAV